MWGDWPGNWESPRGDKLVLGGAILTVDVLNAAAHGGSRAEIQHQLTISQRLQCALHVPPNHFLPFFFFFFFFTTCAMMMMILRRAHTHHYFLWYLLPLWLWSAKPATNGGFNWEAVSLLQNRDSVFLRSTSMMKAKSQRWNNKRWRILSCKCQVGCMCVSLSLCLSFSIWKQSQVQCSSLFLFCFCIIWHVGGHRWACWWSQIKVFNQNNNNNNNNNKHEKNELSTGVRVKYR